MIAAAERIRRTKIFQWAMAYLAAAWLVLQLTDVLTDRLGWPNTIFGTILTLLAIGLPISLVLAWYHGEKGTQRVTGRELVMIGGILVIGAAAIPLVRGLGRAEEAETDTASSSTSSSPTPALGAASIAVLPFENLSDDPENAYFAGGI